jgi:hypothetical protein
LLVERVRERDAGASEHLKEGPQVAQVEWTTPTLTEVAYIEELRQLYRCDDGDDRTIDRDIDRPPSSVWRFDHFPAAGSDRSGDSRFAAEPTFWFVSFNLVVRRRHRHRRGGRHRDHSRLRRRQQLL